MSKLAIVIPVWNNWSYTKKTIQMLSKLPDDHSVIVVDNGSYDQTKDLEPKDNLIIVKNKENLGFATACNQGFEKAKSLGFEHVMFLNNDIKVVSDLETWTDIPLKECSDGSIVGPSVGCLDTQLNFICEAVKFPSAGFSYMSGWNITAKTEVWDRLVLENEVGPFSREFGFAYFEDTDLTFRANELSIPQKIIKVPVKHFGKATSKKLGISTLYLQAKAKFIEKWKERKDEL